MPDPDTIREHIGELLVRAKHGENVEALTDEAVELVDEWIDEAISEESGTDGPPLTGMFISDKVYPRAKGAEFELTFERRARS